MIAVFNRAVMRVRMWPLIVTAFVIMMHAAPAIAQQAAPKPAETSNAVAPKPAASEPTRQQLETQIQILQDYIKGREAQWSQPRTVDPALTQAYIKAKVKEYDFVIERMDNYTAAFRAQRIASYVVLCLVVLVVAAGIAFSGFQLWKSAKIGVQSTSELEISASKVRVTSSVVGVVVLTISIVFLYIYTHEVYHLKFISSSAPQLAAKK